MHSQTVRGTQRDLGRIAARNSRLAAPKCKAPGPVRHLTRQVVDAPFGRRPILPIESGRFHLLDEIAIFQRLERLGCSASIYAAFLGSFAAAEHDSPVIAAPPIPVPINSGVAVAMVEQEQQVDGV
jgi:hypothetical protein